MVPSLHFFICAGFEVADDSFGWELHRGSQKSFRKVFDALRGFTSGPPPTDANTLGWESLLDGSVLCVATQGPRAAIIAADFHAGSGLCTIGVS